MLIRMKECEQFGKEEVRSRLSTKAGDWVLIFSDEFEGDHWDATKWSWHKATYANGEQSYYHPDYARVANGVLTLQAEKNSDNPDHQPYISAALCTQGKFSQTYGRFEARLKLPQGQGYWPAFWLMPEDDYDVHGLWPQCGEIDIMETAGDADAFAGTIHFGGIGNSHDARGIGSKKLPNGGKTDEFHVYAIEWEPTEMRWYVDDTLMGVVDYWSTFGPNGTVQQPLPAPFNKNFYVILNLAVGGEFGGGKLPAEGNEHGAMLVDYVRVYQKETYELPDVKPAVPETEGMVPSGVNLLDESLAPWDVADDPHLTIEKKGSSLLAHITRDIEKQHIQYLIYPHLAVKEGVSYRFSFKASSDVPCKHVRPAMDRPSAWYQKIFLWSSLRFTPETQEFQIDFTSRFTDDDVNLYFYTGLMRGDVGGGAHTITFSDIRLEELHK